MYRIVVACLLCLSMGARAQERKRVVSLAASVTQNLYLLGGGGDIVGCTYFCITDPRDSIPVVADAVSVNMEKIVALHPDLLIASGLTPPKVLQGLERMGIRTMRLGQPRDFKEVCEQLVTLGRLVGRREVAERIARDCEAQLAEVRETIPAGQSPRVFMEVGCNPLFTALPGTFLHDYIVQAGGTNLAQELTSASVSREHVLLQNPDVILVVGMGVAGEEECTSWKRFKGLNATMHDKIFVLDAYVCSPTPVTFVKTVRDLVGMLY